MASHEEAHLAWAGTRETILLLLLLFALLLVVDERLTFALNRRVLDYLISFYFILYDVSRASSTTNKLLEDVYLTFNSIVYLTFNNIHTAYII